MKKVFICIALLCSSAGFVNAQSPIPNNSFENWSGSPLNPDGWDTYNAFYAGSVTRVTPPFAGTYAMKVAATHVTITNTDVFGYATSNFKMTTKPVKLTGYYKTNIVSGDSVTIDLILYNAGSPVGTAHWVNKATKSTYGFLTAPITYITSATPDSASIIIVAGDPNLPKPGTSLTVDLLEFDGVNTTSVLNTAAAEVKAMVYPNPANTATLVSFNLAQPELVTVRISDVLGKTVKVIAQNELRTGAQRIQLSTEDMENGIYFITIHTPSAELVNEKLIVNK